MKNKLAQRYVSKYYVCRLAGTEGKNERQTMLELYLKLYMQ